MLSRGSILSLMTQNGLRFSHYVHELSSRISSYHTLQTPERVYLLYRSIQCQPVGDHISFSAPGVRNPLGLLCAAGRQVPFAGFSIPADHGAKWWSFNTVSPLPYIQYWNPRKASQHAWKIPQSLKAHGIWVGDVKNQNIFILSPNNQLPKTDNLNPLQDRNRALAKIWGKGSIASTESPR